MSINKIAKVGRFLFTESMLRDGFFRRAGVITKISGKRIYYDDHKESALKTEKYVHERTIAAVCDTDEEVESLVSFSRRAINEAFALRDRHKAEAAQFFEK